ncbi:MAG: polysaccharide biosynthesis protein [Candidatus Hydrogenedentes bacterium]|nr:polysaccharide biosynthesis protein [Candidatus Hydrogenedentota bacterium]
MSEPVTDPSSSRGAYFSAGVVAGVPWTIVSKVFLFVVYMGVPILIVRGVGSETYGVYALCRNLGEVLIVFCALGSNTALTRFIPELRVNRDRQGLRMLLLHVATVQLVATAIVTGILLLAAPFLQTWLKIDSRMLLLLTMFFTAGSMARNVVDDVFTALFNVRSVSILALARGFTMLLAMGAAALLLHDVHWILLAQGATLSLFSMYGSVMLTKTIRGLGWGVSQRPLHHNRVIWISLASMFNQLANMLMRQYSEIFFLTVHFEKSMVGMYDLACQVPMLVITFVPVAIQKLFTSGFAEAYARDPRCLNNLIQSYYKALMVTVLPFTALGLYLSPQAFVVFFGEEMAPAGPVAAMFFVIHSLFLISIPLSMAIVTTEKMMHVQPLMLMQVIINLYLDYLLIPGFGMYGAVAAVFGTWFVTIPIRLYVVGRLLNGLQFPTLFFIRIVLMQFALGACFYPFASYLNAVGLVLAGLLYMAIYVFLLRFTRIIRPEDVEDLRQLGFSGLNRALAFLVPG